MAVTGYNEVKVDKKHIYMVKRTYCQNKENLWLSVCITQIQCLLQKYLNHII